MTELDIRIQVLNSILTTPHGHLADRAALHRDALARDPLFYGHLAAWYAGRGEVRDHKVLFAAHMLTSDHAAHRAAGAALLRRLPPHMIAAAVDHAKVTIGKLPRRFRTAVAGALRALEADPAALDRAALRSRRDLKHLYATLRIAPGARAQQILFDGRPPEGSPLHALRELAKASSPAEQARTIVEQRIPYPVAAGALRTITPSVLAALIEVMTPQEVINHLASLRKRGGFGSPEIKALIEAKLRAAERDGRVSTLKATKAAQRAGADDDTAALLAEVTDRRVARMQRIARPTALLVDKSSSMAQAIEVAREIAALVSAVCDSFRVLAFDSAALDVKAAGAGRSAWAEAFALIKADGWTSIGAPLAKLARERHYVEQLVIVTDAGDNTAPLLHDAYADYARTMGVSPSVIAVTVGAVSQQVLERWRAAGIPLTVWSFGGDYYSLPNLVPLLSAPSRAELVDIIMATPLPG